MTSNIQQADIHDLIKELWLRKRNNGEIVWKTKEGKQIPIKDMTTSHIINAINYFSQKEEEKELLEEIAADYEAENFGDR